MVEASRTGNPFLGAPPADRPARPARRATRSSRRSWTSADWDLVIVDEAHKMSAHCYGDEVGATLQATASASCSATRPGTSS